MVSRRQALKLMGVDVWERRSLHAPSSASTEPDLAAKLPGPSTRKAADVPAAEPQPSSNASEAASPQQAPDKVSVDRTGARSATPSFRLGMYHYESIAVCALLNDKAELSRRLCDDMARAAGGNLQALRFLELKWPMLDTAGIDQSLAAAREVVTQKFHSLPGRMVLVGAGIAEYFQPAASLEPLQPSTVGRQTLLLIADLHEFQHSADQKRQLLRCLHDWKTS